MQTASQQTFSRIWPRLTAFLRAVLLGTSAAFLLILLLPLGTSIFCRYATLTLPRNALAQIGTILAALIAILAIFAADKLAKLWRSIRLGLIPIQNWIWPLAVAGFWIAIEWHYPRTAWICITFACVISATTEFARHKSIRPSGESWGLLEPDLPITEEGEDLLNRRDIVESLASTLMIDAPAIVAVIGAYGDGKTSLINLTIGELKRGQKSRVPLIVRFSPWLAGDSNALIISMLDSIVAEIQREFLVPGLSGEAARYARLLLTAAPWTERLKDLFAEPSQERRINALVSRIAATKRRVLIVVDDLDRMEAKELETVFKLLRGSDKFSNMTFLCSLDDTEVSAILRATRSTQDTKMYIEKFFPVRLYLPGIDSTQRREFFSQRLGRMLDPTSLTSEEASKSLQKFWETTYSAHFRNLRTIKSFFNKVSRSLQLIGPEVNPWDFLRLELLRDISPSLYGSIFSSPEYFWERGLAFEMWSKGPQPFDDEQAKSWRAEAYRRIEGATLATAPALDLLADLFPNYAVYHRPANPRPDSTGSEKAKRIFHPRHFWQYFLLKVPSDLFPQRAFSRFLASIKDDTAEVAAIEYEKIFRDLVNEDFKRWYFMHLVEDNFSEFGAQAQPGLCRGMARNSGRWSTDAFELSTAISCSHEALKNLPDSDARQTLLADIIRESESDLYALVLFWRLSKLDEGEGSKLAPDLEKVKGLLKKQLRLHYLDGERASIFAEYGNAQGINSIEPNQFLFSWQALGDDARADANLYLMQQLRKHPSDLALFLQLMFRADFIDDYTTLKALVDYKELSELISRNEENLNPKLVQKFKDRYRNDASLNQGSESVT